MGKLMTAGLMHLASLSAAIPLRLDAFAAGSLSDPVGSSVILSAIQWIERTLLGTAATIVAMLAIASVGFTLLTGRLNWRQGATVILGCFILFGASNIAVGVSRLAGANGDYSQYRSPSLGAPAPPPPEFRARAGSGYDPYAGASLPPR